MAGVFGNLFDSEDYVTGSDNLENSISRRPGVEQPPRPRSKCDFSGLNNQGATCYLNSLIQTLLLTPEFRDGLFCLGVDELGHLQDADKPGSRVRIIPIQLQRLFARLLLKNCQSVSSVELTASFGWNNDEQLQQHDVQELNRILFSAIESSLVGTSGKDLIQQLYHGKIVNQITCTECKTKSEREEDFLDVPVTVAGSSSLEESLQCTYRDVEMLDGKNQYRCSACNKLVDAAKGAKLRSLPSILTISLLRFSFNFQRMERYKETGRFTFPNAIDMRPYCDNVAENEDLDYELFSVVIHSGGAHGGHYHAYIRDIDNLGHWITPDEEEILVPLKTSLGNVDFIECDSPVDLLQIILSREKNKGMPMDQLGSEIMKQTGTSWNKRFKSKHGTMTKFVSKHDDKFLFDPVEKYISLNMEAQSGQTPSVDCRNKNTSVKTKGSVIHVDSQGEVVESGAGNNGDGRKPGKNRNTPPNPGEAWFDFNDAQVHPIYERDLDKQTAGRESAYMLFYRKRSLVRPNKAHGDKTYCMSERLVTEVVIENQVLDTQRQAYEVTINSLTLQIHFAMCYQYREGALKPRQGQNDWRELVIDQRKNTQDLYMAIREFGVELLPSNVFQINKFKELPAGGHLYDIVPEFDDLTLQHLDIQDGSRLFVWNGESVAGEIIPTGLDMEPLYLTVIYGDGLQFSQGYSRSLSVQEVMVIVCEVIRIKVKDIRLKRVFGKDTEVRLVAFTANEVYTSLADLGFKDGDQLLAEDKADKGPTLSEESISSTVYSSKFLVHIQNRCTQTTDLYHYPSIKVEVDKTITVAELKAMVITKFGLETVDEGGRLRIDHESHGLRHPIHEEKSVFDAGISQGSRLVLESGPAPQTDQITLTFTCDTKLGDEDYGEIMVNRSISVGECLLWILSKANITDGDWHLRKTNWCGEAAELLDDPDQSIEEFRVNDGDLLLLEKGRLPPKGYIRLPIWLHPTPESVKSISRQDSGIMSWMSTIYNILTQNTTKETSCSDSTALNGSGSFRSHRVASIPHPMHLGEVEVSRETTLEDLKQQVMTLNVVAELPIPSVDFMRLRLMENSRMTTVLRDNSLTLKRLKLTSNSVLALQILPEEETLNINQLVLDVCQRIPDTDRYNPGVELIWDTSQGAGITSLAAAVSDTLFIEVEQLIMAKHFPQRCEWMVIDKLDKPSNQKGKKKNIGKNNIKQAPFHICDGDTIGVKDKRYDPNNLDDFMTETDTLGRLQIQQDIEEKRRLREERKNMTAEFGPINKHRKPEVGITIKVGDFS